MDGRLGPGPSHCVILHSPSISQHQGCHLPIMRSHAVRKKPLPPIIEHIGWVRSSVNHWATLRRAWILACSYVPSLNGHKGQYLSTNASRGYLFLHHFFQLRRKFAHVDVVKCISVFLESCYLARCSDFDLNDLDSALRRFHTYRKVLRSYGVCESGFSLPRRHSLVHYRINIQDFGAPNGLRSSITAVKTWRRSNRHETLD